MATTNVIAHKNLTDPQLHEPKGVAVAASGTVYVADGAASGSWTNLPFSDLNYAASNVNLIAGYNTIGTIRDIDVSVLTPVTTQTVTDAEIPVGAPIDRANINTALATANKNVKEVGLEIAELRTELIKAFNNTEALKNCLNELRDTLINSGIITGTLSS